MLGACALLFGACDDDDTTLIHVPGDEPAAATLSVSSESPLLNMAEDGKSGTIRFKSGGGELQLDLTTNRTNWEYDCDDESWLEVEADEFANTLSLRAARNKATVSPEATLVLTAGSGTDRATVTLRVSQNAAGSTPDLDVNEAQVVLPARGELTQEFEFSTNQDEWTFDLNWQWLFVEQTDHSLVLTAEPNADTTARTTQIVVAAGVAPNIVRDTVTVMQEAAAYVIPTPGSLGFDDEGGSKTISVACNYDWDFKVEGDWMTVTREGDVLTVAAGKNTGKDPLEGTIAITGGKDANTTTFALPVSQSGYDENNLVLIYDLPADKKEIVLPLAGTVDCTVDWGDGTKEETIVAAPTHTYAVAGEYVVTVSGEVTALASNSTKFTTEKKGYLVRVKQWGKTGLTSMDQAFYYCENLTRIPDDIAHSFDEVTTFAKAFAYCKKLEEIPAGLFKNAAKATSFKETFNGCETISVIPDGLLDGAVNVTTFYSTFAYCPKISKIPAGLFKNSTKVTDFSFVFQRTGLGSSSASNDVSSGLLTEIPAGLLDNCTSATVFTGAFGYLNIKSIPAGLFDHCTEATDMKSVFVSCENLETVPAGLFDKNTKAKDFYNIFNGCKSLKSVPADLFKYNTAVTNFRMTFASTGLVEVPAGLFDGKTKVTNFNGCFYKCENLTTVPADLFEDAIAATDMARMFIGCKALQSVPEDLFKNCVKVTTFANLFEECTSLSTVPAGLFAHNTNVTNFSTLFKNCKQFSAVPADLFAANEKAINFGSAFYGCTSLTAIPADLFAHNVKVTTGFASTFYGCTGLTSVPETLFSANVAVTSFNSTFYGCTGLTSLPAGLFDNNKKVTNFGKTFMGCKALAGESPYSTVDGAKVHLYERTTALGFSNVSTKTDCFDGCTGLSDYGDIPTAWK